VVNRLTPLNHSYRYKDCYVEWKENVLVIGNSLMERSWQLTEGRLFNKSLINKTAEEEWLKETTPAPMFKLPIPYMTQSPGICLTSIIDDDLSIGEPHLFVLFELKYSDICVKLETRVYPETAILRNRLWLKPVLVHDPGAPNISESSAGPDNDTLSANMQLDGNNKKKRKIPADYIDMLALSATHCSWKTVELRDNTDTNNNLLSEQHGLLYPNEYRLVDGNIVFIQNTMKDNGLLWIKESPTKTGQLNYGGGDFHFVGTSLYMTGSGITLSDAAPGDYISIYGSVLGVYQGGEYAGLRLLRQYHQSVRDFKPDRDFFMMCNTWGDRSRDGRIGEAFILSELAVASELGITHYQIDDGWQQGATSNSIVKNGRWGDYYSADDQFWCVHKERFPNGLEPVVRAAKEHGIQLGLWFSPESHADFANWQRDADRLVEICRLYGVRYFKLDGINVQSKRGEMNLTRMLRHVIRETGGAVYFNLDLTAQARLGYFYEAQYFGIFLENRYTDRVSYYPHWTLRNLWLLSKYVPSQKLQIEFLNVERNAEKYGNDSLSPSACGIAYAFAASMFANPLAWMEVSGLSESSRRTLGKLITEYKGVQHHILSGHILPIGEEPTGTGWTGLQSVVTDTEGYLLLFREWNTQEKGVFKLWNISTAQLNLASLTGSDRRPPAIATVDENGYMAYSLETPLSFALLHYKLNI
jgi:hypothetical protein